jgi:hypothetical protein
VIPEWHPAHAYRGAYADKPSTLDGERPSALENQSHPESTETRQENA